MKEKKNEKKKSMLMIILSLRTPDYLGTTPPRIDLFLPDLDASEHT